MLPPEWTTSAGTVNRLTRRDARGARSCRTPALLWARYSAVTAGRALLSAESAHDSPPRSRGRGDPHEPTAIQHVFAMQGQLSLEPGGTTETLPPTERRGHDFDVAGPSGRCRDRTTSVTRPPSGTVAVLSPRSRTGWEARRARNRRRGVGSSRPDRFDLGRRRTARHRNGLGTGPGQTGSGRYRTMRFPSPCVRGRGGCRRSPLCACRPQHEPACAFVPGRRPSSPPISACASRVRAADVWHATAGCACGWCRRSIPRTGRRGSESGRQRGS
jgi:hypothetical protein